MKHPPLVQVGILHAEQLRVRFNAAYVCRADGQLHGVEQGTETMVELRDGRLMCSGTPGNQWCFEPADPGSDATFTLFDVPIGISFHWERKQTQTFRGELLIVVDEQQLCAINRLPVEEYLTSVISSEMSQTASLEFLKAHAVISRSWLLAQCLHTASDSALPPPDSATAHIRWYDHTQHTRFDVCADDHCQRYQGIGHADNPTVRRAVEETRGLVLTYGDEICDARFSKCCGGRTETFDTCWADTGKPYLAAIDDPYCNTSDTHVLSQVLNDYDQETTRFYRWTERLETDELSLRIAGKLGIDVGTVIDLVPLRRGASGRISLLRIVGTKRTIDVGKELEIRRALSPTHLLSSAFEVERTPSGFLLHGKGWGHGVGLCQIGAAVMGEQGKTFDEILRFYYRGANISKLYD